MPWIHAGGGRVAAGRVGRPLRRQHHGRRAVRGRARLEVAERVPQHDRLLHHVEGDVGEVEVGVGVLQRVQPVLHRHHHADVARGARAAHVGPDDGGEVAARAGQQRRREGLGHRQGPHGVGVGLLLEGDGEHPLVDARRHQVRRPRWRSSRRPSRRCGPAASACPRRRARRQVQLGHHDALEHVGRLADDHGVDVGPRRGRRPRGPRSAASRTSPAMETSSRLALCLVWPTPMTAHRSRHQPPSLQHAHQVLLQAAAPRWRGPRPGRPSRPDAPGRLADADQAGRP